MKNLFILLLVVLSTAVFTSCSDDDNGNTGSEEGGITMTIDSERPDFKITTLNEGDIITVDWGDGHVIEYISDANEQGNQYNDIYLDHTYNNSGIQTIVIKGKISDLYCPGINLISLDVTKCTALEWLFCHGNQLTSLDVSKCTALEDLDCCRNQLTTLDVSKCTALETLNCTDNQLTSLDVSKCTALQELKCDENQLTSLDVSGCTVLTYLSCRGNQLNAAALNKIFTDLPVRDDNWSRGGISTYNNPGSGKCDISIAEKKGWDVYYD